MTVRLTAPRPGAYDLAQLRSEADAVAPGCRDVNEVAPDLIAAYWPDHLAPDQVVWRQVVAAHVPPSTDVDAAAEQRAAIDQLIGSLSPDELQRVVALGVLITTPEAVDALTTAVAEGDAAAGVAVVAEVAQAAADSVTEPAP